MDELKTILKDHAKMYPAMKPQDAVMIVYQNNFGGAHFISDERSALASIRQEIAVLSPSEEEPLYVPVGHHMCRLNLRRAVLTYSPEDISGWFVRSARGRRGALADYMASLKMMRKEADAIGFPFSPEELDAFLAFYRGMAFPAIHHSPEYREAYDPHYRIVTEDIWNW